MIADLTMRDPHEGTARRRNGDHAIAGIRAIRSRVEPGMDIDRFLASNDGVVSLDQARECGLSDKQVQARVRHGEWLRRASEVYFATAWTWTPAARVRVAGVWAGPRGALASVTAAWWLGLGVDTPSPLTVVLPHGSSRRPPPFVTVRQRDPGPDRQEHRGLPVTSTALTVLDAAVALGAAGPAFLDRALQEHVDLDSLRRAQNRHLGRRGSPAAGRLLARAGDRAASEPERRLLSLLRGGRVTGWEVNLEVTLTDGRRAVLDLAFPDARLVVEVDSWAHHVDPHSFVDDRARKRALVADGWTVVEVTWADLEQRPEAVLDQIRRVLARLDAA